MDKVRRILVSVCRDRHAAPQTAQFIQSVTGHFSVCGEDEVQVTVSLDNNKFVISKGETDRQVPLKRPSFCPIKHLSACEAAALPLAVRQRGVDVGVAIILQTANQRVLLSRRAKQLRIFPNVWVPPGGHLEPDETLLDAGLRELMEETGLRLEPEEVSPKVLGLWESVYPAMLSRGPPQRHHIVVYMLLHSTLSHHQLQASLSPSVAEVSACLWADAGLSGAIVSSRDGEEDGHVTQEDLPDTVSVLEVCEDGSVCESTLPVCVLTGRPPLSGPDTERVSTGTKYALQLWMKTLH